MDRKQTVTLLTFLQSSYPRQAETLTKPEVAEIWHGALADLDYEVVKIALTKWVMTEKWPPTIADIRESVTSVSTAEIMDWSKAWSIVNRAVRLKGPYQEEEALASFDEVTRETVNRIRWSVLCEMESDERDIMRAHFRDIYTQIVNRHKEQAQMPIALKQKISAMQIGVPERERLNG